MIFVHSIVLVLAALLAAPCQAQTQCDSVASQIPQCGMACVTAAASQIGCASFSDYACECASSSQLASAAENCVYSACGNNVNSALGVMSSASAVCACVSSVAAHATPVAIGIAGRVTIATAAAI